MSDLLEAALGYAAEGVAVFPCTPEKAPLTVHGFSDATTDAKVVRSWWKRTPDALIGAAVPDGIAILDIDPRNGGNDSIKRLAAEHGRGSFPSTRTAATGGGGVHRWYAVPEGVELRAHLAQGVDVKRAGRGYVILPPSRSVVGEYRWRDDREPAEMPAWLLESLQRPEPTAREVVDRTPPTLFPFQDGTAYGERAMELELEQLRAAQIGGRNDALNVATFNLAQLVAGGELKEEPVRTALQDAAAELGLDDDEADKTIDSAWEAGVASPRTAPATDDREATPRTTLDMLADEESDVEDAEAHFWLDWSGEDEHVDEYILEPVLPRNAYVLVYGPTEASKSMVFNALGAEASLRGFTVSVYSLENPPNVDRSRLRRLQPDPTRFRLSSQLLNLADPKQATAMMERERGRDLVILDTYSHAYAQRYDSGDGNAKAIEFARVMRWLIRKTGATFVVIDHTGFERLDEPRDASAKRQQVDVAIGMERTREWQQDQPACFRMTNHKSARFANPFTIDGKIHGKVGEPLTLEWLPHRGVELEWGELR